MMTSLLFLILLTVIILALLGSKKASIIFFIIFSMGFILIGYGVIPILLLKSLEVPSQEIDHLTWKKKNAIIVLGAGISKLNSLIKPSIFGYSRILTAAELYSSCKKNSNQCVLILSGGDPQHLGVSEAEIYRNELERTGIKDANIVIEPKSRNTYENARFTHEVLRTGHFDSVVLVTSGFHMKRSLDYFNNFGIRAVPIIADYVQPQISFLPFGYNFALSDFALHEMVGIVRLWVYNYFGWNSLG